MLSLGGLALVGRSSPALHGYFFLDLIAALRYKSLHMQETAAREVERVGNR